MLLVITAAVYCIHIFIGIYFLRDRVDSTVPYVRAYVCTIHKGFLNEENLSKIFSENAFSRLLNLFLCPKN